MARKGLEPSHDEHVNVTPLIDIVMCLIIFFMICGKLAKDINTQEVTVPKAANSQELGDQRGKLVINIVKPALNDNGQAVGLPKLLLDAEEINFGQLDAKLRERRLSSPDIKVTLRADEVVSYEFIAPVLVACAQADIKSVHFSTVLEN